GFDLFLSFKLPLSKKQIAQRKNFKNRSNNSSTGQFEESKVSDSSGSDFILSDEIYSSDSTGDIWMFIEREFQED
ncbi:23962_t:CDS:2, partial [Entrophospora sp. SA101]